MGGQTIAASPATRAPVGMSGTMDPGNVAGPSRSALANRVTTAPSAPPRAGVLSRIGTAIVNGLKCLFSAKGSAARSPAPEKLQREFQRSVDDVRDALFCAQATTETIRESLLAADAAATKLQAKGGTPGESIHQTFQQAFAGASTEQLGRIAKRLDGEAIAGLQSELIHQDHASQMLVRAHAALYAEMTARVESNVRNQLGAAIGLIDAGGPEARITEHLQLAFAAAVPLVKNQSLKFGYETDKEVRQTVLDELAKLPKDTLHVVLSHLSFEDLGGLSVIARRSPPLVNEALAAEIVARPKRLTADLQVRTQQFVERYGSDKPIDRSTFLRELSGITRKIADVNQHVRGLAPVSLPELQDVKRTLTTTLQQIIASGKVDLTDLMAIEISELTSAFSALDAAQIGTELLGDVQHQMLRRCCDNLERSLEKLGTDLISGRDPEAVLKRLAEAATAAMKLESTRHTLRHAPDNLLKYSSARDIVEQWFAGTTAPEKDSLHAVLRGPGIKSLMNDLDQVAYAARAQREVNPFQEMRSLLEGMQDVANVVMGDSPRRTDAATLSPELMRKGLSKLYGVEITGEHTTLNAGRFNADQTEVVAKSLERPLSAGDLKPARLGTHTVPDNFLLDARRRVPQIWIPNASGGNTPLIDHEDWPSDLHDPDYKSRDARIAAGYERLIAFCGGDEEKARAIATHLNQQIVAGLDTACMREDSPLRLEDGTAGCVLENDRGGGHLEVDVNLSIGENGRPQFEVGYSTEGRNSLAPARGGMPIILSGDSAVHMNFRAELGSSGALTLLNTPSYSFSMKTDEFQKPYEFPNAAQLRSVPESHAALLDALIYAQPLGKDYQIKALRALDVFERSPTVNNAAAVIAECDRGGLEVSEELRKKVDAELANMRVGVLAAFDGPVAAARHILTHQGKYSGVAYFDAKEFVAEVERLKDMPLAGLLEAAEKLHELYLKQPPGGHRRSDDDRTLPIDREVAVNTRVQLTTQRHETARGRFASDAFGNLSETLTQRIDTEVLPGLIDAVKRGEI